jgi:hypothetical protein
MPEMGGRRRFSTQTPPPEKLKTLKPEMVHGFAATRISDFQNSSFPPPITGTGPSHRPMYSWPR